MNRRQTTKPDDDIGPVIDIRSRVRKDLEDAIDRVAHRCAVVADELSQDGEPVAPAPAVPARRW